MSSDAKVWKDKDGWHAVADFFKLEEIHTSDYELVQTLQYVEDEAGQSLNWEIFEFKNGLGLRGYRAKPS
jgi:hypothetical protein